MAARTNSKCSNGSLEAFGREGLVTCDPPNVSVNANSGDPHYEPKARLGADQRRRLRSSRHLGEDEQPDSVYYDITWTGSVGTPSDKQRRDFQYRERRARRRHQHR